MQEIAGREFSQHLALLATKDDVHKLEIRMEQGFKEVLKWIIVLMLGFSSLIVTIIKLL
jgi:hypothetical protein